MLAIPNASNDWRNLDIFTHTSGIGLSSLQENSCQVGVCYIKPVRIHNKRTLIAQDCVKCRRRIAWRRFLVYNLADFLNVVQVKKIKILFSRWWHLELVTSIVMLMKLGLHAPCSYLNGPVKLFVILHITLKFLSLKLWLHWITLVDWNFFAQDPPD